jgi:hypothetical protein
MKSSGEAQSKKDLDSLPLRHIAAKYLRQIPSQATESKAFTTWQARTGYFEQLLGLFLKLIAQDWAFR